MTITDELNEGQLEFTHLKFVEFLEFLGRLAFMLFENTAHHFEKTLEQKLETLLRHIFHPLKLKVVLQEEFEEVIESESDDDY